MDSRSPFFFLHVMKTGGTTLAFDLREDFAPEAVYPGEPDRTSPEDVEPYISVMQLLRAAAERPAAIRLYTGHFAYVACERMPMPVRTLTLLREPVERTISVLKHFQHRFPRYDAMSLEQIYEDEFVFEHFVHDHQTKLFSAAIADEIETFASRLSHLENLARHRGEVSPAETATFPVDAARLARAQAVLAKVDVVGVTERYGDFIADLRTGFGWWRTGAPAETRVNVSPEAGRVSSALRGRIAGDNRFDMDLYDFVRDLIERRRR